MNRLNSIRLATIASLWVAAAPHLAAQTATVVAQPSSLTFDLRQGTPPSQNVSLTLTNATSPSATVTVTPSPGLRVNNQTSTAVVISGSSLATVFVSVDPFVQPGVSGSIQVSGSGVTGANIPVCFIRVNSGSQCTGTGTGSGNFFASTTALQFSQTGTVFPSSQSFTVSSSIGVVPTYNTSVFYTSGIGSNWLQVIPSPGFPSNSSVVQVTPITTGLGSGTYTATLTLTPTVAGYTAISIPITLTVGTGTGTGNFYASPSVLTYTYPPGTTTAITQQLTINAATQTSFSVTASSNLAGIVSVNPVSGITPNTINVTVNNPNLIPANTTGTLTITPLNSLYSQFTVPIQINSSGSTSGSVTVNPASLTYNVTPGTTTSQSQIVNVTSTDGTQQSFSVATSSTNSFLSAFTSSTVTPATITVGVNPAAISQPGTYSGFVTVTPFTGIGAGVPITIPVTVNVGSTGVISPGVNSTTLEARAGSANPVSTDVRLDVLTTIRSVDFTAAATTASGGNWLSINPTSGTAPGLIRIIANPANLAPGSYTGTVTVTPIGGTAFNIAVTFTVTASGELRVAPASLAFAHQTTSSSAPASQTVTITSTGTPLNWAATATSTGNWLQVTPASGTTGTNNLTVSVTPTGLAAGTYNGSISVSSTSATNPAQTIPVTLTVSTPVLPGIGAFVNGASFGSTVASPGLIVTITGSDLGPTTAVTASPGTSGFPTTLGETQVLFDGRPAPLLYTSASQVSAVVPFEIAGRVTTRVQVSYRGQLSRELELRVSDAAPGIFTLNQSGTGQGAVLNQNGTVNGVANPERRGNVVVIYATGLGVVFPAVGTGLPAPGAAQTPTPARVRIGGIEARVVYSGAAPGLIGGAYQINAVIPEGVAAGTAVPVSIEMGTALSQPGVTIAVQ